MTVVDVIWKGISSASPMELIATALGLLAVWLTTRENLWNFPLGLIQVVLIGIVLFQQQLYADTFMQGFYFCALIYGWWCWTHPHRTRRQLAVSRLTPTQLGALLTVAVIATAGCAWGLAQIGDAMPWRDAFIAVFGIASQWLQARKKMETWPGWVLVNTAGVIIFVALGMYFLVFLYALYWVLSFVGWRAWHVSYRLESVA